MASARTSTERLRRRLVGHAPTLRTLAARTYRDSVDDRLPGLAAEVAFFLLLSLPPLLLVMLGTVGYVGELFGPDTVAELRDGIVGFADNFLTRSTVEDVVEPAVTNLLTEGRADILSLGVILAVWSASRAIRVFVRTVTVAYDLEDRRSWWQHRLLGLGLTIAGIVALTVLLPLLVVGPRFGAELADRVGLGRAFELIWNVAWYPVVIVLGLALLAWVYHVVPPHRTRWRRDLPGAALALAVWALGSLGLRTYAVVFVETDSAYSLFGAPLVLLLWIYVSAFALLLGAELNAEIEKLWPGPDSPYLVASAPPKEVAEQRTGEPGGDAEEGSLAGTG